MTAFQRPGVYVQETLNPIQPVVGPDSDSIAAFVGINDRGPATPTLVSSWSQYVNKFGSWNTTVSNDLPLAVYMYFANGGSQAYVTRVLGDNAQPSTRTLYDRASTPVATLQLKSISAGTWGNPDKKALNVTVTDSATTGYFTLSVYFNGTDDSNVVERFTDITMTSTDARYAVTVINASSNYITAIDLASASAVVTKNPSTQTNTAFASGSDGSAVTASNIDTTVKYLDVVTQSLVLNVAGYTDATVVNNAIAYANGRTDVFVVIDGAAVSSSAQVTLANSYTASSQAAVYYPRLTISDPTLGIGAASGSTKLVGPGGAVTGLFMATDASRGVYKAPAGLTARVAGAVSVTALTNAELDTLNTNSAAINAIRYIPGAGIVVMGSRTLKTGYVDKYVPVRRTLIYLEKAMKDLTEFALFEPNDERLWRRCNDTISNFLRQFWAEGGLRGVSPAQAFFVKVDADNNPQYLIDNGELHIEVGVSLQRPAEFVVIKIGQFDGGTTVTVA